VNNEVDPVPRDEGSTLYESEHGDGLQAYWTNYVRVGLVWDTRDRETAPRRGTWSEVVLRRVDQSLGADLDFTQWMLVDRRYFALGERLVLAHRYHLQGLFGGAPVEQLQRIDTSFREGEGLGGSTSLRGVHRNRYTGEGMLSWNAELRGRVKSFRMMERDLYVAASVFLDQGRVWTDEVRFDELLSDLHRGYGVGLHGGMGENLVASLYAGVSAGTRPQVYVLLGYLF
jgi:outer membrane protein assembly factor BamA